MTVVAYRIRCRECGNNSVLRDSMIDDNGWVVNSKSQHVGICPACNPSYELDEDSGYAEYVREVKFEKLENIGQKGADNLRDAGIVTHGDVMEASDEEILSVPWVGEAGLESIQREVEN